MKSDQQRTRPSLRVRIDAAAVLSGAERLPVMSDERPNKPEDREARLAEIRRQIAAGTYETPARLEAAIDAFLDRAPRRCG
jgi:anti-sigma-28 factor FlgM